MLLKIRLVDNSIPTASTIANQKLNNTKAHGHFPACRACEVDCLVDSDLIALRNRVICRE